jgi:LuxR family maltose regulon positive regulatory protein
MAGLSTGAGPVVIATKLHIPACRRGHVQRERLVHALAAPRAHRLSLVSASAGAGKTTLLSEWAASAAEERAFAWLSLDPQDSDPVQFWTCVIAALRTVVPGVGADAQPALEVAGGRVGEVALALLVNDLAAAPAPLVLVLDDYHLVVSREVHDSLAFLLDHLPPNVHVALATRSDPPLPLARLRARGQLLEVRTVDLRFSASEAASLLNGTLGLSLADDDVARLQAHTEGWAAGLQLAGLTLRRREHPRELVGAFGADDREIVDYLGAEVLETLDASLRAFLIDTSILDRMCGPLCDAVTDGQNSASVLHELDALNLFVVALDDKRHWYRYHHLFGEHLRHELARRHPERVCELHRRASLWHQREGSIPEAVDHALAAGETALAGELIGEHWSAYFNRGQLDTIARWLSQLPADMLATDPRLWLAQVWTWMDLGRLGDAAALIERAAGATLESPWVPLFAALHAFKSGDVGRAEEQVAGALHGDAPAFARTAALCVLGATRYWLAETDGAVDALEQAAELARLDDNRLAQLYTTGYLALAALDERRDEAAERLIGAADTLATEHPGVAEHFVAMINRLAGGALHQRRGDLQAAAGDLRRAVELSRRGAARVEAAAALLAQAEVSRALGELDAGRSSAAQARQLLASCADPGRLGGRHAAAQPVVEGEELSERELAVLRLLPTDLSQREIGSILYVSLNTVKTHTRRIFAKLGVGTREDAVRRARERGLL